MSKIQVYCAVSLDGFVAGPDDDLSWLGEPDPELVGDPGTVGFPEFMAQTGAMLMGRRTFDVVMSFGGDWPYGSTPVLVATSRAMSDAPETVSACRGDIRELCQQAKEVAGDRNVYVDGGTLVTQALEAHCVDELILTVVPVLLGHGVPLYGGKKLQRFHAVVLGRLGTMTQS
ncbi:MAG: dihydrofolate reductase family protein, partial [Deltaproteobacteria bacterium]|nr:dihydrofolate reductase family protein [Deltaproteobacteria bacterium]